MSPCRMTNSLGRRHPNDEHTLRRKLQGVTIVRGVFSEQRPNTRDEVVQAKRNLRAGACDYLCKDRITAEALGRSIRNAMEKARLARSLDRSPGHGGGRGGG